jgi:excinuclease ABC subunit B
MFKIVSPYHPSGDQPQAIQTLLDGFKTEQQQCLLGVTGSGKTFTMAHVIAGLNQPCIILAHNKTLAAQLYQEMKSLFPYNAVEYFVSYYDYYRPEAYLPTSDTYLPKESAVNDQIDQMRLSATKALLNRPDTIVVATVSAIYGLGDPHYYHHLALPLTCGQDIAQETVLKQLTTLRYERNDTTLIRGTYRTRGAHVDIFPAESDKLAIRVTWGLGNVIDTLHSLNPLTGQCETHLPSFTFIPKTHYVTPKDVLNRLMEAVKQELAERLEALRSNEQWVAADRLERRTTQDIAMIQATGYCHGIENYSRYLSFERLPNEPPPTLLQYLSKNGVLCIDESHVTMPQIRAMYEGDRSRKCVLIEHGFRLPSALDNRPLKFDEVIQALPRHCLYVSATPGEYELKHAVHVVEQLIRPTGLVDPVIIVRPALTQIKDVITVIQACVSRQERMFINALTCKSAEDLSYYLQEKNIKARYLHAEIDTLERSQLLRALRQGVFDVLIGINLLREGLDVPEVSVVAILDADKEGFLRSHRSLIQTIGRAARHVNGCAIFYADRITPSMQAAISETERRRSHQLHYNQLHNITPTAIVKPIPEPLIAVTASKISKKLSKNLPINLSKTELHQKMLYHAERLEFEEAAYYQELMNHHDDL